jgi:hypothetical protein
VEKSKVLTIICGDGDPENQAGYPDAVAKRQAAEQKRQDAERLRNEAERRRVVDEGFRNAAEDIRDPAGYLRTSWKTLALHRRLPVKPPKNFDRRPKTHGGPPKCCSGRRPHRARRQLKLDVSTVNDDRRPSGGASVVGR